MGATSPPYPTARREAVDWITDQVALGNYQEARDSALLKLHGFRPALSLDGALAEQDATEFGLSEVVSYPLVDGPGNDLRHHPLRRCGSEEVGGLAEPGPGAMPRGS